MSHRKGALPDWLIREAIRAGNIKHAQDKNVQSSSLDLSLTGDMYRFPGLTQLRIGERARELIERIGGERHNIQSLLEVNVVYFARLDERVRLNKNVYGYCNPKSSTGRVDVHVRVVADGVAQYDTLYPAGFQGELWAYIIPRSIPIKLFKGIPLAQLRLFTGNTRLSEVELELALKIDKILWHRNGRAFTYDELKLRDGDGSIILTADLGSKQIGWECIGNSRPLDLSRRDHKASDFFRSVNLDGKGNLELKQGHFYILSTEEFVRVPPHMACEMRPMNDRFGDFRGHYAGFIDPGWGWGKEGKGKGRPLTLEVRPHENMVLGPGQAIAKVRFERMLDLPKVHYDAGSPNYGVQNGPKLAKYFIVE